MPGARYARSLAWKSKKPHELVTTVAPDHPAFPHANGFNGLLRALPGESGLLVTVIPEKRQLLKNLTPASRRQDHTTSPSAKASFVL